MKEGRRGNRRYEGKPIDVRGLFSRPGPFRIRRFAPEISQLVSTFVQAHCFRINYQMNDDKSLPVDESPKNYSACTARKLNKRG